MKELTKYYIDLSKLSEEERRIVRMTLYKNREYVPFFTNLFEIDKYYKLHYYKGDWLCGDAWYNDKTELTYDEFIKLFEEPTKLPSELLKEYFKNTPREQVLKDWESTSDYDNVNSPKVLELFEGGEEKKINMTFGITDKNMEIINKQISRFEGAEFDRLSWEKVAKEIGWDLPTIILWYFRKKESQNKWIKP